MDRFAVEVQKEVATPIEKYIADFEDLQAAFNQQLISQDVGLRMKDKLQQESQMNVRMELERKGQSSEPVVNVADQSRTLTRAIDSRETIEKKTLNVQTDMKTILEQVDEKLAQIAANPKDPSVGIIRSLRGF